MPATVKHTGLPPQTVTLAPSAWLTPANIPLLPPNTIPLSAASINKCKSSVKGRIFPGSPISNNFHSASLPNTPLGSLRTGAPNAPLPPTAIPAVLDYVVRPNSRNVSTRDRKKFAKSVPSVLVRHSGFPAPNTPAGPAPPAVGSFFPVSKYNHITVRS